MVFETINPYDLSHIAQYNPLENSEVDEKIQQATEAFQDWRKTSFDTRSQILIRTASVLRSKKKELSEIMVREMGKPIVQALPEIEKSAWVCEYYAEKADEFLSEEYIDTDATQSFVSYDPLGVILAIMPWNFPYWQVFRFLAPTLMAGNVALLKHSPNVFGCAVAIERLMEAAGLPEGVFQNLIIDVDQVPFILKNDNVKAVSLTGSEKAGAQVAATAAKHIKKSVLELGGSNAFIVLEDADLNQALETGITARMQNSGQSCIAAKRFLIAEVIAEDYIGQFQSKMEAFRRGDPQHDQTTIGPLARVDLAVKLEEQVRRSVEMGAKKLIGGGRDGAYFEPTILTNVKPGMPAFDEELFGPVAAFSTFSTLDQAISLSNLSPFGLGVTVFTKDLDNIKKRLQDIEDGAVFVNEMVKSDPRLPFGGTKYSGIGRELGKQGILEFVNVKTVYLK